MSLVPTTLRDWLNNVAAPLHLSHLFDKTSGEGVLPEDLLSWDHRHRVQNHPLLQHLQGKDETKDQALNQLVKQCKDGFVTSVDVSHFTPEEITVEQEDGWVTVEGKHEERRDDHGFVSRHFVRKYRLSGEHDTEKLVSLLSSDGMLTIRAPRLALKGSGKECKVSVVQPGKRAQDDDDMDNSAEENNAKKVKQ